MARKRQAVDFEKALAELETQVHRLESGEAGIRLSRDCQQSLAEAEQKVKLLVARADGSAEVQEFEADDDSLF